MYFVAMRVIVTAGPTREYIDSVRFITNASSGRMGYACAELALAAGHEVTLISGPTALAAPAGVELVKIVTVAELQAALEQRFDACDALIMSAAVGDFTVSGAATRKISRRNGPITLELVPTPDILEGLGRRRRQDIPPQCGGLQRQDKGNNGPPQCGGLQKQRPRIIIGFAVEDENALEKAREEMRRKNCDYYVLNGPAAMGEAASRACILGREGLVLPWAQRDKRDLAGHIVGLLKKGHPHQGM
jgi:phosphopantothenoylcysteine decarboxylase / phosphopantothenate---cysteine ligase